MAAAQSTRKRMTLLDGLRHPSFYIRVWFKPCPRAPTPECRNEIPEIDPAAEAHTLARWCNPTTLGNHSQVQKRNPRVSPLLPLPQPLPQSPT
jgi:hypothetical protein